MGAGIKVLKKMISPHIRGPFFILKKSLKNPRKPIDKNDKMVYNIDKQREVLDDGSQRHK